MANESCLKWTAFQEHMVCTIQEIFESHQYTDCRLVVPEGALYANRTILCLASRFFEAIFVGTRNSSAIETDRLTVLIPDLKLSCLRCVLQFIYTGEVYLRPDDVAPFVEACTFLQIRGVPHSEDRTVGINFGTFTGTEQEGTIANNSDYETAAYKLQQRSAIEIHERSNALTVETESVQIVSHGSSIGESSSPNYVMENEDSNATVQELVHEGTASLLCQVTNSADGIPKFKVEQTQSSTIYAFNDRSDDDGKAECAVHLDPSSYETRLNAAIDAILNRGISYRVASKQYNVSKTVLWRKTMKMSRLVRPTSPKLAHQRREAIDALKSGEKLVHVSQRFEIPLSTLHRDKIRLYKKGILPSQVTLKQRDKGESFRHRLTEAVTECIAGRMSLSEAARAYELPKTSIWRKVQSSRPNSSCTVGAKEVARNLTKCDHDAPNLNHRVETIEVDAEHTVGDMLSATLQASTAYMSDPTMVVDATELTQDSIIL